MEKGKRKREIGVKERKERKGELIFVEEFMRLEGKINIKSESL